MLINGLITVALGYLFGSVPLTYMITMTLRGRDVRELGDGSAHTSNVFHELGLGAASLVALLNAGKGAAAGIAIFLILPNLMPTSFPWQLLALLAVVAGHMRPLLFKFRGGYGLAVSIGILALIFPRGMLIALGIAFFVMMLLRNPVLAVNLGLLAVPVSAFFQEESLFLTVFPQARVLLIIFPLVLGLVLFLNYLPVMRRAVASSGSWRNLVAETLRVKRSQPVKAGKSKKKKRR